MLGEVKDLERFAIVGVQTRWSRQPLRARLEELSGRKIDSGILDITFTATISRRAVLPAIKETRIEFNISNRTILLVDDVIFTGAPPGRARDAHELRAPARNGFVLVDRGNREPCSRTTGYKSKRLFPTG